jgi:3-phosphoshikimate 1-carboxyvinyltransferase
MIAKFTKCTLSGDISAPPSKSMAHRYLIGAALTKQKCDISGIDYSEDILATIDCLKALGCEIETKNDMVSINPQNFLAVENPILNCRESGSTLRFFIPLCLTLGKDVTFKGATRLFERPLDIYQKICIDNKFKFKKNANSLTVCGNLQSQNFEIDGSISSQFITGLIFSLVYLKSECEIKIIPPFESRSYINLTIEALNRFGAKIEFSDELTIKIHASVLHAFSGKVEGDFSNAAFLDGFNFLGSDIRIHNLNPDSLQGDKIYIDYFKQIQNGTPTLDITDCPDLAPVLIALSSLKNGATLTGTNRLKIKESNRGEAMHQELVKLGGGLLFGDNIITIPKQSLHTGGPRLYGHNDHRIVMALSLILSQIGGEIDGAEAVKKSYPNFFTDIKSLKAKVELL